MVQQFLFMDAGCGQVYWVGSPSLFSRGVGLCGLEPFRPTTEDPGPPPCSAASSLQFCNRDQTRHTSSHRKRESRYNGHPQGYNLHQINGKRTGVQRTEVRPTRLCYQDRVAYWVQSISTKTIFNSFSVHEKLLSEDLHSLSAGRKNQRIL